MPGRRHRQERTVPARLVGGATGPKRREVERPIEIGEGDGGQQGLGIGMNRRAHQAFARRKLDDPPRAHDGDPVGHVIDDGEVVGNEQIGQPELGLQILQQVEDLRLDRDVER